MWWFIFAFVAAVSYWLWVQKDDDKRVESRVSHRMEEVQRAKEQEKRQKYIELVQRRLDKSD